MCVVFLVCCFVGVFVWEFVVWDDWIVYLSGWCLCSNSVCLSKNVVDSFVVCELGVGVELIFGRCKVDVGEEIMCIVVV